MGNYWFVISGVSQVTFTSGPGTQRTRWKKLKKERGSPSALVDGRLSNHGVSPPRLVLSAAKWVDLYTCLPKSSSWYSGLNVVQSRTQSRWSQQHSPRSRLHPWSGCQYGNSRWNLHSMVRGGGKDCPGLAWGLGQPTATSSGWSPLTRAKGGQISTWKKLPHLLRTPDALPCLKDERTGTLKEKTPLARVLSHRPPTRQALKRKLMSDDLYFTSPSFKEPNSLASFIEVNKKKKIFE